MDTTWPPGNIDDFQMPELLYKYRDWKNDLHKSLITERLVYLSRPTQFEDPLDCKNPDRYDLLSEHELFERILKRSNEINPSYSKEQHLAYAKYVTQRSPARDPIESAKIQERLFQEFDNQVGVLSLTHNPLSFKMWEKYSDGHKGFCVGFHGRELFKDGENRFGMLGDVIYVDVLPIVNPKDELLTKVRNRVFYKLENWAFEEEYRFTKTRYKPSHQDWRLVDVPEPKFREIIFGAFMSETDKQEIIQLAKGAFPNLVFRQAEIDEVNETIQIKDLDIYTSRRQVFSMTE